MSAASAGVMAGYSALIIRGGQDAAEDLRGDEGRHRGRGDAGEGVENIRPMVMAGLAKLVEEVNQYAAPM